MDRADGLEQAVGVRLGQGRRQVAPDLGLIEGQQQQGTVGAGAGPPPLLAGEVGVLVAQGAEVLGAAGDQQAWRGRAAGRGLATADQGVGEQGEQVVGEGLAVGGRELDQHLVQPVEDHQRALIHQRPQLIEPEGAILVAPAAGDALSHGLAQGGHPLAQPGDMPEVEVDGDGQLGLGLAELLEGAGQPLARDGLAHAVLSKQGEQGRGARVAGPREQVLEGVHIAALLGLELPRAVLVQAGLPAAGVLFHALTDLVEVLQAHVAGGGRGPWAGVSPQQLTLARERAAGLRLEPSQGEQPGRVER